MRVLDALHVTPLPGERLRGALVAGGLTIPCALGRGGVTHAKREGDGATPAGAWPLRRLHYRADRLPPPRTGLPVRPIAPDDGWCDAPDHPLYNRLVRHPFAASAEHMWRDDRLYDCVVELGYNDDPVRPGLGSAIFMHICAGDFGPTEGCVAVPPEAMAALLPMLTPRTLLVVGS